MSNYSFFLSAVLAFFTLILTGQTVTFKVDMTAVNNPQNVGVRGSEAPLSWEKTFLLTDADQDGIYEGTVTFEKTKSEKVQFKYIHGEEDWELQGGNNRKLDLNQLPETLPVHIFDVPESFSKEELEQMILPAEGLQKDIDIMEKAYTSLHPGLYRYNTPEEIRAHFDALRGELSEDKTLTEAFLAFARFIPKIRCGHTIVNPYNQNETIQKAFFYQSDKVPFTFQWVGKKMVVTHNLSESDQLKPGVEILSINGHKIEEITEALLPFVSADGHQMNKRMYALQLGGIEKYEYFDIFFPLLFPPENGRYAIQAFDHQSGKNIDCSVAGMSRLQRTKLLAERYQLNTDGYDGSWSFDVRSPEMAVLKMGTFSIWNFSIDYKAFLKDAFQQLTDRQVPNLVIDIRGNEGGADEVIEELTKYLLTEDMEVEQMQTLTRYQKVPEDIRPYLPSWDETMYDISSRVEPAGNGFFREKGKQEKMMVLKASKNKLRYDGKVFMLTDAANSSATFYIALMARQSGMATLVGQTTGGTLRGINGGMMFFLNLPNSGIEMDIPLLGNFPYSEKPDLGIEPDVRVERTIAQVIEGRDPELEAVQSIISGHK